MKGLIGPIIGHVTTTSARIWMRGQPIVRGEKGVGKIGLFLYETLTHSQEIELLPGNDYCGVADFDNLKPDSHYEIACVCEPHLQRGSFRTDTETGSLRFAIGSCRYLFWDNFLRRDGLLGDKIFESILHGHEKNNLDFFLFLGDQIYADPLNFLWQLRSLREYYSAYRTAFSQPHLSRLLSHVPSYMILDDHEIMNNWSRDFLPRYKIRYEAAMQAYKAYQHSRNPGPRAGQYFYTFYKKGFPFFVLDTRTERLKHREMIGHGQMRSLKDWLYEHKQSSVRFVGTSVAFFPGDRHGKDGWSSYENQREEILNYIRTEKIGPTVFLAGDYHASCLSHMVSAEDSGFNVVSVVSSPLYWPYGYGKRADYFEQRTLEYRGGRFSHRLTGFISQDSYAVVEVDPNRLEACRVCFSDRDGGVLAELPLFQ